MDMHTVVSTAFVIAAVAGVCALADGPAAQSRTVYDPSATDPRVVGALDAERRMERALIGEYEQTVATLLADLTRDNHALAIEIASLPETIRGYGHIKATSVAAARKKLGELLARYRTAPVRAAA